MCVCVGHQSVSSLLPSSLPSSLTNNLCQCICLRLFVHVSVYSMSARASLLSRPLTVTVAGCCYCICIMIILCNLSQPVCATFGSKGKYGGGDYGSGGIELCQCPNIPAPTKYVAVEVPKPVRVTTISSPASGQNVIPIVLPDKDSDGAGGGGSSYGGSDGGGGGYD